MELIDNIVMQARAEVAECDDMQLLDEIRVRYLGKKGKVTALLKSLGRLEADKRRRFGQAVNAAKIELADLIVLKTARLESRRLEERLASERIDVTLPGRGEMRGGLHPVTRAMQRIIDLFAQLGF